MKKIILLLVAMEIVSLLMNFQIKESQAAPKILIKAITAWPVTHMGNDYYKKFIERLNERSKGEIEIKLLGGPEVITGFDQLKAASIGAVDMFTAGENWFAGITPEFGVMAILCNNQKYKPTRIQRESGMNDLYAKVALEKGKVFYLGSLWTGFGFYIATKNEVLKLDDIRGLKLRTMGGLVDVLLGELGASLVKVSGAEAYEAMQRGVVDGALRNSLSLVEFREYEVMKYILLPSFTTSQSGVFVGETKWNTIPKKLQKLMEEVIAEVEEEAVEYYGKLDKLYLKDLQEKYGMKINYLSDRDIARANELRASSSLKDWIYKKAPKYGPPIYEKTLPYIK